MTHEDTLYLLAVSCLITSLSHICSLGYSANKLTITQILLSGLALEETQKKPEPDTNSVVNVREFLEPFASFIYYQVDILNLGLNSSDTCLNEGFGDNELIWEGIWGNTG